MNLNQFIKESGNEFASVVDDGVAAGDVNSYIDTGSFLFNALLSGSIHGGLPSNKITALAGESATGKTYFALGMVKNFLDSNPDAGVLYFESESAIPKELIVNRGIDPKRMVILPVVTIQEFRTQAIKILDAYLEENEQKPMMFVLDSLGNLSTTKELQDTAAGAETRDYQTQGFTLANLPIVIRCYIKQEDALNHLENLAEDVEHVIYGISSQSDKGILQFSISNISTDEGLLEPLGVGEVFLNVVYEIED